MANLIQADPLNAHRTRHQEFCAFYRDETLDPCQRSYERIMDRFDPEFNATSHVTLLDQAVGSGPVPQAYLCCIRRQNQVRIVCIHLPSCFIGALDGQVTPWDGLNFACIGEVVQGQINTVIVPENSFRIVRNVLGDNGLPHLAADEADANMISTRALMYVPARYVPLLLNPAGYSLHQLWENLYEKLPKNSSALTTSLLANHLFEFIVSST
jgi:hypothetical protein